ncbi:MAG: GNAT family N-acetyltransferase [Proteobacteria bacterium]|nr:GNAT family N-acetyltransferase [Pseudomonadota bacterium]
MTKITIRKATPEDSALILKFITELAIYEKAEEQVIASEADIKKSLFTDDTSTQAIICLLNDKPIGFAVYFFNYSTWLGKHGLYLEDLYITPEHRSVGAGMALMKYLAKIAVDKNCGRFEWSVLDWNDPAIKFYQSIGAKPQDEWVGYRLEGKTLEDFALTEPHTTP